MNRESLDRCRPRYRHKNSSRLNSAVAGQSCLQMPACDDDDDQLVRLVIHKWAKRLFLGCVTRPRAQMRVTQPRKALVANLCRGSGCLLWIHKCTTIMVLLVQPAEYVKPQII